VCLRALGFLLFGLGVERGEEFSFFLFPSLGVCGCGGWLVCPRSSSAAGCVALCTCFNMQIETFV